MQEKVRKQKGKKIKMFYLTKSVTFSLIVISL